MVEVFDSFDTAVSISERAKVESSYSVGDGGTINIDYTGIPSSFPRIEITSANSPSLSGTFLVNGSQQLNFSTAVTLTSTDVLILDFEKQIYELNGNSIIDKISFPSNELIKLIGGETNTLTFYPSANIDVSIDYYSYQNTYDIRYLESFSINEDVSFEKKEAFNKNRATDSRKSGESYSFDIEKIATDLKFYNSINSESVYRIQYNEQNPDTGVSNTKYLVGVRFENWSRDISMEEFIMTNVSGFALNSI